MQHILSIIMNTPGTHTNAGLHVIKLLLLPHIRLVHFEYASLKRKKKPFAETKQTNYEI